jgi:hypothetical protein
VSGFPQKQGSEKEVAQKTGTDDLPVEDLSHVTDQQQSIAQKYVPTRPKKSISVPFSESDHTKTPTNKGFLNGEGGILLQAI